MHPHRDTDPLARYAAARTALAADAGDRGAQYEAVLSMARLGATRRALADYGQFGLGVTQPGETPDEDRLALKARLHKDMFLKGDRDAGSVSADLYAAAHAATGGTYSGINAAAMALLTGRDEDIVEGMAREILAKLGSAGETDPSDRYFRDATRAEAFWLLGDIDRAEQALRTAITHDPLNYTAHAATLKQMRLIADCRGLDMRWLDGLRPPRPISYAGHIWREDADVDEADLRLRLSDLVQRTDIGFAYGALAAGADIVMAEACLEEGVELHLCLPGAPDDFREISVRPYGEAWLARYAACLDRAASITHLPLPGRDYDADTTRLCAEISMGQAILQSRLFATRPGQVIVMDPERQGSATHRFAERWKATGFGQDIVTLPLGGATGVRAREGDEPRVAITGPDGTTLVPAAQTRDAIRTLGGEDPAAAIIADFAQGALASADRFRGVPGTAILPDRLAAWMTLQEPDTSDLTYAGFESGEHLYGLDAE